MTARAVDLPHLRSVVLAGHAGAGKTTLAEQLLFRSGAIPRLGRVDDGTASLDYEPEEQKRHESLGLAVASLEHDGHRVTLVDTPGYPDFIAEVVSGFYAADAALLVMDASGPVEAGLEKGVAIARSIDRTACFVINKCDRENADPAGALDALRAAFGNKIAPLQLAIGSADAFEGYVDLVHRRAFRWDGKTEVEMPIPESMAAEVARRRDQLLEAAAEADDDVLTKYLEGEEISDAELDACLHRGVRDSLLAPVLVASAAKGIGLAGLLDAIIRYFPAPSEEPAVKANDKDGAAVEVGPDPAAPLVARVFKTAADPYVGRLTYLRVLSGTLRSQSSAFNANRGEEERIGQLLLLHGKDQEPIGELKAGEIGAIAKLSVTHTGETLSTRDHPVVLDAMPFPEPTLVVAIEPQTKADLDKMGSALQRMLEEEPSARVERSAAGEQILVATGEAHVAVISERLKRKFGAAIVTRTPRVPTLYDGSFHPVDSNELSFKIAASMALKDGVLQSKPVLLEPIMAVTVTVPEQYMGDVNRDLNGRRGRVLGMDGAGDGLQAITAHVPQSELFSYATELRSLTAGRGSFSATLDHYEEVPGHVAERVIAEHKKEAEAGH
jgi:elongation factor G